jgi:hypothetical protein
MKKQTIQIIKIMLMIIPFLTSVYKAQSQYCNFSKVLNTTPFTVSELESKWQTFTSDPGFKILADAVTKQGFIRIAKNEKTAWGFNSKYISDSVLGTSVQEALVCTYDFYRKTTSGIQMCSMVWRKVGGTTYKSYIVFPVGENDFYTAIEKSTEFFVDENNTIQQAHSFGKCWARCVFKRFSATNCAAAMAACGAAAAGLVALGIGVTTPIALGIFGGCAGVFCLAPLAICAAYCL